VNPVGKGIITGRREALMVMLPLKATGHALQDMTDGTTEHAGAHFLSQSCNFLLDLLFEVGDTVE
jgi:selenocysteine lyase/cysteine desulfurase